MQVTEIHELSAQEVESILNRVPLYRGIRGRDADQFKRLCVFPVGWKWSQAS